MTMFLKTPMNRRTAFKVGAGLGVAGAAGALGYQIVPPSPSEELQRVDALAQQLYTSLDVDPRHFDRSDIHFGVDPRGPRTFGRTFGRKGALSGETGLAVCGESHFADPIPRRVSAANRPMERKVDRERAMTLRTTASVLNAPIPRG
jgi:hypothetical protein